MFWNLSGVFVLIYDDFVGLFWEVFVFVLMFCDEEGEKVIIVFGWWRFFYFVSGGFWMFVVWLFFFGCIICIVIV